MARIAVDAMGGDNAPRVVVRGAVRAVEKNPATEMILVGDEAAISRELQEIGGTPPRVSIVHAPESIGMDEHPVEALKSKRRASLPVAVSLVQEKRADAVISAGNTGALVAASTLMLRLLPGVRRAGIATTLPSIKGKVVIMDVGANVNAKPAHLQQYAIMADIFYRHVLASPDEHVRVGLLSVGAEEGKGSALIRESHSLLSRCGIDFMGNVEGHDIFEGVCPVVVCDGVIGNIVLKTAEGLAEVVARLAVQQVKKVGLDADERWQEAQARWLADIDWREVGGAALLGVQGVVVIAHGRSDERAIASGIRIAASCCEHQVNNRITQALQPEGSKAQAAG